MQVKDLMSDNVICIAPGETAAVAARTLARYNIGALPVCRPDGTLEGIVTDRDLVVRGLALGADPRRIPIRTLMTRGVDTVNPEADVGEAAREMAKRGIRRLPVVESGRLCGMVSLGDLARVESGEKDLRDALRAVSGNVIRP